MIKDFLMIAAIGAAMIGLTLSPSAQEQTFGVAGRSLMMFCIVHASLWILPCGGDSRPGQKPQAIDKGCNRILGDKQYSSSSA
ncbi:MAG TPA: hypothetical protein VF172_06110 [Nitrososphaera sp.]